MLPAVMPKNSVGAPSRSKSAVERQSGWEMMPDAEPLRFEHAADDRHAEARVIDIGVARHQDHVALVPAEQVHFLARHRQERRGRKPVRPILAVPE